MKKNLLQKQRGIILALMSFLCVIGIQAQTWTAPVPVGSVMTNNQQYYVYNVGSKAFLDRGGEWDAQAIVTPSTGALITTVANSALWNLEYENSSSKCLKYNAGLGWTYTDGAAASYPWNVQVTDAVNNVYSIQVPSTFTPDYNASQYLGTTANLYSSNKEGTVYDVRYNRAASDYTKWMFVTATDLAKYNAQVLLDRYMSIAKYVGSSVDLTSYISTYNTGTTSDITTAVTNLQAALTVTDNTTSILNPNFTTNAASWTNPNGGTAGSSEVEFYQKNPFNFYQTVTGLTPGVYVVKMQGFQRTVALATAARTAYTNGSDNLSAKFYATASNTTSFIPIRNIYSETTCSAGTTIDGLKFPNTMAEAQTAFTAGLYDNELGTVIVDGSGSLTLGVSGVYVNSITGQWQVIDNFRLYYYGALTTTTWDGFAWSNGTPTAYVDAVINGTYNGPGFACYSLVVGAATTFTSDATINGILTLNNTLTVDGANALTINNTISGTSAITATSGTVVFNGSSAQQSCPLVGTVANLTINNSAGVTLGAATTVSGTLTLSAGTLTNSTFLTLANGATIVRTAGSLSALPTVGTTVNVTYDGLSNITMGNEITGYMNSTKLNNLTVSNSISVTLPNKITVNGNLNLAQSNSVLWVANNGNDVTLYGDMPGSGYIEGNGKGISVSCNGSSPQTLRLTNTTNLNLNNPAGVTLGRNLGFTGTTNANVFLNAGQLNLSTYTLTLNASNTISRVSGSLNGTPVFGSSVNVAYLNTTQSSIAINGSTSVTLSGANTGIAAGMGVTGTGIAAGTTVASVSGTALTLSQAATASATNTLTYSTAFTTGSEIPASATVLGNLTINTPSGVTLGSNATVNSTGTLTFTSGNLTTGSNTLTLTKAVPTTGSGYIVTGSTGTVVYAGSAAQTISNLNGAVYNLTVNNAAGATLGAATTVNGTLALTSGTLATGANALTLKGATSGAGYINTGTSGTLAYGGTAVQTLASTNLTGSAVNSLVVNAGSKLTLSGSAITATNFTINSDATNGAGTILDGGLLANSSANVNQYLTSGRNWYVSSPVGAATTAALSTATSIVSYDEVHGTSAPWVTESGLLTPMKGYISTATTSNAAITFTGTLNTGNVSIALTRTAGQTKEGFNLVGNPYPSNLTWTESIATAANTLSTIWYRTYVTSAYAFHTYNATGGIGSPAEVTGVIPPMQAFWVRANAGGGTLSFDNTMRSHSATSNPLKAPAATKAAQQLLRLQVSNGTNSDEAVVYFNPNASDAFDAFDSPKMTNANAAIPEIYTVAGTGQLAINGLNSVTPDKELLLGFTTGQSNSFTIKATEFSNFDAGTKVYLRDNVLNTEQELTDGTAYGFNSNTASTNTRFNIVFKTASVATGSNPASANQATLISKNANNQITVNCKGGISSDACVSVYNELGQKLYSKQIANASTVVKATLAKGVYVITVNNGGQRTTRKVVLN